jgi:hypothetical protein
MRSFHLGQGYRGNLTGTVGSVRIQCASAKVRVVELENQHGIELRRLRRSIVEGHSNSESNNLKEQTREFTDFASIGSCFVVLTAHWCNA